MPLKLHVQKLYDAGLSGWLTHLLTLSLLMRHKMMLTALSLSNGMVMNRQQAYLLPSLSETASQSGAILYHQNWMYHSLQPLASVTAGINERKIHKSKSM